MKVHLPSFPSPPPSLTDYTPTVIHLILTPSDGQTQLPFVLKGQTPPANVRNKDADAIATCNYSDPPKAIVFGGGYSDEDVKIMREACQGFGEGVVWLRPDLSVLTPPFEEKEKYGMHMVTRVREALGRVVDAGRDGEGREIVWY